MKKKKFFREKIFLIIILLLLVLISGCKGKKSAEKSLEEIRSGTQGIAINFLLGAMPEKIHVVEGGDEATNSFDVVLEVRNVGAFPQPDEISLLSDLAGTSLGTVHLSGYDSNILSFDTSGAAELDPKILIGKSTINPDGGLDIIKFAGRVKTESLDVEKYEPILLATACYSYITVAGPSVCIDPNPYSTIKERKVCEVQDITLSSQGAPIAITRIDEEALAAKTQFKITIKNVGNGDVIKSESLYKCQSFGQHVEFLGTEDIDKVYLKEVKISKKQLKCGPFIDGNLNSESGYIRLTNGEGLIICELPRDEYKDNPTAFTTPLQIKLIYAYRTTTQQKIQIIKERIGIGVDSADTRNIN